MKPLGFLLPVVGEILFPPELETLELLVLVRTTVEDRRRLVGALRCVRGRDSGALDGWMLLVVLFLLLLIGLVGAGGCAGCWLVFHHWPLLRVGAGVGLGARCSVPARLPIPLLQLKCFRGLLLWRLVGNLFQSDLDGVEPRPPSYFLRFGRYAGNAA